MKRYSIVTLASTLFFLFGFYSSNAAAQQVNAFQGEKLFVTHCYLCHGLTGKGDGPLADKFKVPPADLTDLSRMGKWTDSDLFGIIDGRKRHGRISEEMPKWGGKTKWGKMLSEPQIRTIVAYIRFISQSKYPLIGDPEAGEKIYAQYCSSCHGKDGKGNGIMTDIMPIKPADHTNAARMDEISNEKLLDIVANGKGTESFMPGWKGILSESEMQAVVSYIRFLSH